MALTSKVIGAAARRAEKFLLNWQAGRSGSGWIARSRPSTAADDQRRASLRDVDVAALVDAVRLIPPSVWSQILDGNAVCFEHPACFGALVCKRARLTEGR